jgi:hypothetical protein
MWSHLNYYRASSDDRLFVDCNFPAKGLFFPQKLLIRHDKKPFLSSFILIIPAILPTIDFLSTATFPPKACSFPKDYVNCSSDGSSDMKKALFFPVSTLRWINSVVEGQILTFPPSEQQQQAVTD